MSDAIEAFRWLREFDYSVEWFAKYGPEIRTHLGCLAQSGAQYRESVIMRLDAVLEHAAELTIAAEKLKEIVNG